MLVEACRAAEATGEALLDRLPYPPVLGGAPLTEFVSHDRRLLYSSSFTVSGSR